MLSRVTIFCFLFFTMISCGHPRYADFFPCHDDGTVKPKVVFLPIGVAKEATISSAISEEVTQGVYLEMRDRGELYLLSLEEVEQDLREIGEIDLLNSDKQLAEHYVKSDFLVVAELVEHDWRLPHPCSPSLYKQLHMRVRLRILDLRYPDPRVILQEVLTTCVSMPYCDEAACARAHQQLSASLALRVENEIRSVF